MTATMSVYRLHDLLAELWRGKRVAGLNFLVFIDDEAQRERIREQAMRIAAKHPTRLLILNASNASGEADLLSMSQRSTEATIVSEQLELAVGGFDPQSLSALTQELCVHDVPTVLWWTPLRLTASNDRFSPLITLASHIVVDSSASTQSEATLRDLTRFVRNTTTPLSLRDLAWMRLACWQDIIAQFFDDPAMSEELSALTSLEIGSGSAGEALYLSGWLASRLGWVPVGRAAFRTRDGREITFELAKEGRRGITRIALATRNARCVARLNEDAGIVTLCVEGEKAKEPWMVPLSDVDDASLLERALLSPNGDELFEATLRTVHDLLP